MSIIKVIAILLLPLSAASLQTDTGTLSESKTSLSNEFKTEYTEHKKLAAEEEWGASLIHVRKAYELVKQLFDANDKNSAVLAYDHNNDI